MQMLLLCPEVFYHPIFEELFQVPAQCVTHDCLAPYGKSHYVYATFVVATYEKIISMKIQPERPYPGCKIAVLVEPRVHPLYEYTVKQVMSTLGAGWSLQLFVSEENEKFVGQVLNIQEGGAGQYIVVTQLSTFGLDGMGQSGNRVQSAFSAHQAMYSSIQGEHILWFQLDVIMRKSPPVHFFQHAYIGSEWQSCQHPCVTTVCKGVCGGGNSGLSLRRRSKILPVATKGVLPRDLWGVPPNGTSKRRDYFEDDELHNNSLSGWFEDDLQISYKLATKDLLPSGDVLSGFALGEALPIKGVDKADPCGLHKPWMVPHIHPSVLEQLLRVPFLRAMGN